MSGIVRLSKRKKCSFFVLSGRSLQQAIVSLLRHYEEDFRQPPDHPLLNYLREQIVETTIRDECQRLFNRFVQETNEGL